VVADAPAGPRPGVAGRLRAEPATGRAPVTASPRVVDAGFRALNALHRGVLRVSGGRVGGRAFGMEVVELETVGRRTGRPHVATLTVPVVEGTTLVLVASKGGDDRGPDWLMNLLAQPRVVVTRRGQRASMSARVATPEERSTLWPQVVASFRFYASYQRRAAREIPLVICTLDAGDGPDRPR
jgi:deazaflavin-dependent oxidoreductase (nitroreductase family)